MKAVDLRDRTKNYSIRIIKLSRALPRSPEARVIQNQLLRSAMSVGAQFREGYRAKSGPDFVSKMTGALQELDESLYWLELLSESGILAAAKLSSLIQETNELIAILVTIIKSRKSDL